MRAARSAGSGERPARFAGSWYPGQPAALRAEVEAALPAVEPAPAKALISPHAGYRFSLRIAAAAYARVQIPEVAVVLCPNHSVPPPIVSLWARGSWETPLGSIPIEEELGARILAECPQVVAEERAHLREHAVELQLPILQVLQPRLRLVPLVVAQPDPAQLRALGEGLARALAGREDVLLVASTDMSHFESAAECQRKDAQALERLEAWDPEGLLEVCARESISMCGVRPTAAVLVAAQALGATTIERVASGHSGQISGDDERVVGYASLVIR